MTFEEWCWIDGLAHLLGYTRPSEWAKWVEGFAPIIRLLGRCKTHRTLDVRSLGDQPRPRCGFLRIDVFRSVHHYSLQKWRDFDIADPDSMEKAAAFVRASYTKAQREWETRHRKPQEGHTGPTLGQESHARREEADRA